MLLLIDLDVEDSKRKWIRYDRARTWRFKDNIMATRFLVAGWSDLIAEMVFLGIQRYS